MAKAEWYGLRMKDGSKTTSQPSQTASKPSCGVEVKIEPEYPSKRQAAEPWPAQAGASPYRRRPVR